MDSKSALDFLTEKFGYFNSNHPIELLGYDNGLKLEINDIIECLEEYSLLRNNSEAIEFVEWVTSNMYCKYWGSEGENCGKWYQQYTKPDRNYYTSKELYKLFKESLPSPPIQQPKI